MAAIAAALTVVPVPAHLAQADPAPQQGWWTITNAEGADGPLEPPIPPDVPPDGLLVQGGSSEGAPTAYAALVYQPSADATVGALTLAIAPGSGSTPGATLQACPLTRPTLTPAQGGPMADAPAYDCNRNAAAEPADDGSSYHFELSTLAGDGVLAIAILPLRPADRVVFSKPSPNAVDVTPPAGGAPGTSDAASSAIDGDQLSGGSYSSFSQSPSLVSGADQTIGPGSSAPVLASPPNTRQSASAGRVAPASSPSHDADRPEPAALAVIVAACLLAVALWTASGALATRSRADSTAASPESPESRAVRSAGVRDSQRS